jgi:hypothetical protein
MKHLSGTLKANNLNVNPLYEIFVGYKYLHRLPKRQELESKTKA